MSKKGLSKAQMMRRESVANALGVIAAASYAEPYSNAFVPDRVTEANAALFDQSHYSEALTGYAVGYRDESGLDEANQFYGPDVPVGRFFQYMEFDNEDYFKADKDDRRAIGEDFKRVKMHGRIKTAKVPNRGLMMCVDEDEVGDDPNWRERKVGQLINRLKRNSLRRKIALLKAAATASALVWDQSNGKDPDQDIIQELIAANDESGLMPNRVGYGHGAWAKRVASHRAQNNAGGFASAGLTAEQVAGFLNVDEVHVTKSRYQDGSDKAQVLANEVLAFTAEDGLGAEDASNIKNFYSPVGGERYRVYEWQVGPKLYNIVVEHYELPLITSLLGIRLANIG